MFIDLERILVVSWARIIFAFLDFYRVAGAYARFHRNLHTIMANIFLIVIRTRSRHDWVRLVSFTRQEHPIISLSASREAERFIMRVTLAGRDKAVKANLHFILIRRG